MTGPRVYLDINTANQRVHAASCRDCQRQHQAKAVMSHRLIHLERQPWCKRKRISVCEQLVLKDDRKCRTSSDDFAISHFGNNKATVRGKAFVSTPSTGILHHEKFKHENQRSKKKFISELFDQVLHPGLSRTAWNRDGNGDGIPQNGQQQQQNRQHLEEHRSLTPQGRVRLDVGHAYPYPATSFTAQQVAQIKVYFLSFGTIV